ncbi:MAG TPA: NADH-quinone oxidoreductase subunit N [Firmicutes bacterium]|nr:NADH-quinone oxidoreductase subunit N [Bacillota bacterium]
MTGFLQNGIAGQLPEFLLVLTALAILIFDAVKKYGKDKEMYIIAVAGASLAFASSIFTLDLSLGSANGIFVFSSMTVWDSVSSLGKLIILLTLLTGLILDSLGAITRRHNGEYLALMLFAATGAMVMSSASHLVTMILGLEILSLPLYTLAAFDYDRKAAREAGLKYLILGAFASAFAAIGCALYYIGSGTLEISVTSIPADGKLFFNIGCALILSGLMFKGGVLPFFAWSPDTYEGAPDFAVGLMAALAKTSTFLFLARFVPEILSPIAASNLIAGIILAVAGTMIAGNLLALAQTNIKRMLAYSSVAHAGYLLLGIIAFRATSTAGIIFYLAGYAPVLVGCFHIVAMFPGDKGGHEINHFAGLGYRSKFVAAIFTLMLITLAGLPPTPIFWGKLLLFLGVVEPGGSGLVNLVILAMLMSLVGVYYYLRVVVYMYMREPDDEKISPSPAPVKAFPGFGFSILCIIIAVLGIFPYYFLRLIFSAVENLMLPGLH